MSITHTSVAVMAIGRRRRNPWRGLWLVDSGASTTRVPGNVLRELGVRPIRRDRHELAVGPKAAFDVGGAQVTLRGVTVITEVRFGPAAAAPLLGAITRHSANLVRDARRAELVPSTRLKPLKHQRDRRRTRG